MNLCTTLSYCKYFIRGPCKYLNSVPEQKLVWVSGIAEAPEGRLTAVEVYPNDRLVPLWGRRA